MWDGIYIGKNKLDRQAVQMQLAILNRDGYHAAADMLQGAVDLNEGSFFENFSDNTCFDRDVNRDRLRCLWTAHCLMHGIEYGSSQYTDEIREAWDIVMRSEPETAEWDDEESFQKFMSRYMV